MEGAVPATDAGAAPSAAIVAPVFSDPVVFEAHSTPVALVRIGASPEELRAARAPLLCDLSREWVFPKDASRLNSLFCNAFVQSERQLYDGIFRGHPQHGNPSTLQAETHSAVLAMLGTDVKRAHLPRGMYAQTLPVRQDVAPGMRDYVRTTLGAQPYMGSSVSEPHRVSGVGLRGAGVTGTLEVRMPGRAVLVLFPTLPGNPSYTIDDVIALHTIDTHENALCYSANGSATPNVLDAQFEPSVVASSLGEFGRSSSIASSDLADDKRSLNFVTRLATKGAVVILFRGNLTYTVKLTNATFAFSAMESAHRAMQVRWQRQGDRSVPSLHAGFYERSLIWVAPTLTQMPFAGRDVFASAHREVFENMPDAAALSEATRERTRKLEAADASCYPYVDPEELVFATDGMVLLHGTDRLVMRRDCSERGARGGLVLFALTGTLLDAFPMGRLTPVSEGTRKRLASELPYRYERYTEAHPGEHVAICGQASTVLAREHALNAHFGPPALSFLVFQDASPVPVAKVATPVAEITVPAAPLINEIAPAPLHVSAPTPSSDSDTLPLASPEPEPRKRTPRYRGPPVVRDHVTRARVRAAQTPVPVIIRLDLDDTDTVPTPAVTREVVRDERATATSAAYQKLCCDLRNVISRDNPLPLSMSLLLSDDEEEEEIGDIIEEGNISGPVTPAFPDADLSTAAKKRPRDEEATEVVDEPALKKARAEPDSDYSVGSTDRATPVVPSSVVSASPFPVIPFALPRAPVATTFRNAPNSYLPRAEMQFLMAARRAPAPHVAQSPTPSISMQPVAPRGIEEWSVVTGIVEHEEPPVMEPYGTAPTDYDDMALNFESSHDHANAFQDETDLFGTF